MVRDNETFSEVWVVYNLLDSSRLSFAYGDPDRHARPGSKAERSMMAQDKIQQPIQIV